MERERNVLGTLIVLQGGRLNAVGVASKEDGVEEDYEDYELVKSAPLTIA